MKPLSFILLALILSLVSCGGKDGGSSSNSGTFSSNISTKEGYFNLQTQQLEVGGSIYPISDNNTLMVIQNAMADAQRRNVPPVYINGVRKLRAKVTASLNNQYGYNNGYGYPGYNPYPTNGGYYPGGQGTLVVSQVYFY